MHQLLPIKRNPEINLRYIHPFFDYKYYQLIINSYALFSKFLIVPCLFKKLLQFVIDMEFTDNIFF